MAPTIIRLAIPDVLLIKHRRFDDERGSFMETFRADWLSAAGLETVFVQDNQADSVRKGTLRGLHFQRPPFEQAKLFRVVQGAAFDVAVDLRAGSPTFARWVGVTLSAAAPEQLFIPRGFAHGYCTLEPDTRVAYKCDEYYEPRAEAGVLYSDPGIGVEWPFPEEALHLAEKDRRWPLLAQLALPAMD